MSRPSWWKGIFLKLITMCPEILQAASCFSGKSEDGDVRVILSWTVPQAQPALSFKKSYERAWERLENRNPRAKLKFKCEIRKRGEKCQGFSGEYTGKSRGYLLWRFRDIRLSPPTLRASQPQRQKSTSVFFRSLGASLSPVKCSRHPTCIVCMSLCKSPSVQNMITSQSGTIRATSKSCWSQQGIHLSEEGKNEKRGIAVAYRELWQCREMGSRKCCWSSAAGEGPANGAVTGQAVGGAKPWWSIRDRPSLEPPQWKMSPESFCRTQALEQSPQQHQSLFGGSNAHLHADRLHFSHTSKLSLRSDGLSLTPVKFCSLRVLCRHSFNHYPNMPSFLGKYPVIYRCLSWGPVESSPCAFRILSPYPTVPTHWAHATTPMMGFCTKEGHGKTQA